MRRALPAYARDEGIDPEHPISLEVDNAGWHRSPRLTLPPGLNLVFLPPYSPEFQPAERLWLLLDDVVANRVFATITEMEDALASRCRTLEAQPDCLHAHTLYQWWPVQPHSAYAK